MSDQETLAQTLAESLEDALLCTRVWEAWGYGTMTQDDFVPAGEDSDFLDDLAKAVLASDWLRVHDQHVRDNERAKVTSEYAEALQLSGLNAVELAKAKAEIRSMEAEIPGLEKRIREQTLKATGATEHCTGCTNPAIAPEPDDNLPLCTKHWNQWLTKYALGDQSPPCGAHLIRDLADQEANT